MRAAILSVGLFIAGCADANATILHFATVLSGKNEQVPNSGSAAGTAAVTLNTDTRMMSYRIEYAGLSAPPVVMHFHGLRPTAKTPPEVITIRLDHPPSPVTGSQLLNDRQITQLEHGDWYANIHTRKYPDGEIRGWLVPASDTGVPQSHYFGRPKDEPVVAGATE